MKSAVSYGLFPLGNDPATFSNINRIKAVAIQALSVCPYFRNFSEGQRNSRIIHRSVPPRRRRCEFVAYQAPLRSWVHSSPMSPNLSRYIFSCYAFVDVRADHSFFFSSYRSHRRDSYRHYIVYFYVTRIIKILHLMTRSISVQNI